MNVSYNLTGIQYLGNKLTVNVETYQIARNLFDRAHRRALLRRLLARLTRHPTALRVLAHSPVDSKAPRSNRVSVIPLERIVGSESRSEDFDNRFNPLKNHDLERWIGIALARKAGVALPAVELVRDGDDYYVRDGHHRISVAKFLGQLDIEAVIVN